VIVTRGCGDRIGVAQAVLPNKRRGDPRVTGVGQVAVRGAPYETAVARGLEPAAGLAVRDNWLRRGLLLLEFATPTATMPPVPAPVAVIEVTTFATFAPLKILTLLRWAALGSIAFARHAVAVDARSRLVAARLFSRARSFATSFIGLGRWRRARCGSSLVARRRLGPFAFCAAAIVSAVCDWSVARWTRISQRLAVAIRILGVRAFRCGTRITASTASVRTSAFCHEMENKMRDNTRAHEPRKTRP
jgi:hypothetical protein